MSSSRILSDEHADLVLRFDRVRRERRRVALRRAALESSVALSTAITKFVLAQEELTDELQTLLSVVLARQATARGRLAGRAHPERWLDLVVAHAVKQVRAEVLT
ncbi:hypothetical protein GCM10018965_032510 [Nonomuraea roseola]